MRKWLMQKLNLEKPLLVLFKRVLHLSGWKLWLVLRIWDILWALVLKPIVKEIDHRQEFERKKIALRVFYAQVPKITSKQQFLEQTRLMWKRRKSLQQS